MQVSVETLSDLERRVTVQVPAEKVAEEIRSRLQSLSRKVKVDGFRPGKAPLKLLKKIYGDQVRYETVTELMKNSLEAALIQENLNPLGGPNIQSKNLEEGQDLEYSATFEIMPEFEPVGFETIQVERPVAEVTGQDVDDMIETLRQQRVIWSPVERPAQTGDQLHIDFNGRIDGQNFPGGSSENASVVLGKGVMIKDFEDQLIGLSAGAEISFDLTFPNDYHAKSIAGQTAHFQVKVNTVEEANLPEVDDAFAESFDIKEGGVAGLRQSLRDNMERELRDGIKAAVKHQVLQGLLAANPVPLPQALIEVEIERLARQLHFPPGAQDEKNQQLKTQLFGTEARRRVALGLLLSRLATTQNIKADEQRVQTQLETVAASYQDPAEVIRWHAQNPQAMESIHALVIEDQLVEWLLERAQVSEKPSTFAEIMKPARPQAGAADQSASEESTE